jgi:hypothetical protein
MPYVCWHFNKDLKRCNLISHPFINPKDIDYKCNGIKSITECCWYGISEYGSANIV